MDWRERDRRLEEILDRYSLSHYQFIAIRRELESLMEEDRNEAYEDGAEAERECNIVY